MALPDMKPVKRVACVSGRMGMSSEMMRTRRLLEMGVSDMIALRWVAWVRRVIIYFNAVVYTIPALLVAVIECPWVHR